MKLSEVIAMVEDWLSRFCYHYNINSVDYCTDEYINHEYIDCAYIIRFSEYTPTMEEQKSFFYVPLSERRIYNENGDDIFILGKDADSDLSECKEWYDEFEKKWRYGNEK